MTEAVIAKGPTMREIFPFMFTRTSPSIDQDSPLVMAASLLRFHTVEATLLLAKGGTPLIRENKASYVGSFAILENMLKVTKKYYYECLFWPCSRIATELDVIGSRQTLSDLLALYGKTRFGFSTAVEGSLFGIIGITDVMRLYYDDKIATTMVAGDVAEKGISTEHDTPLTDVLQKMFELRIRRLFVGGEDATFVSDREIVSFMFSPSNLIRTRDSPESLLDASIGEIPSVKAEMVESDMPLAEVAFRILYSQGLCIMCDKGLVSPWDTVMKPFALGRLRMPS